MSKAFDEVIERLGKDQAFRHLLITNPQIALRGYDVTDEERDLLGDMDEEKLVEFAGRLGDDPTKGSWTPGG